MNEVPELTLEFLRKHPQDAARVLQSLSTEVCCDFIQTISPALAAELIQNMSFDRAALQFASLPALAAAAIIEKMKTADAVVILRLISGPKLEALLGELPEGKRKIFRNQTRFPAHTVGAWMDASPIEIGETLTVEDARRSLRRQNRVFEYDLFVVDFQGTVTGMVPLSRLALAKSSDTISKLMTKEFKRIQDRDNLESVRNLEEWDRHIALPVINHRQQLVGVLLRRSLDKALSLRGPNAATGEVMPLFGELFKGYLEGMIHVVDWFSQNPNNSETTKEK